MVHYMCKLIRASEANTWASLSHTIQFGNFWSEKNFRTIVEIHTNCFTYLFVFILDLNFEKKNKKIVQKLCSKIVMDENFSLGILT